ncbi:pineapple eye protein isoform X3 [Drosophila sulfurigaster albostrigata]|uniref:pineapple eye protein isoform X3 n=1 Tax=Drosophila sulfurigaster albostrigata TaxID=89887 RepID=UPI002D21EC2A|nr:pineapple eye protein isoform X3 [Drosophila sulfurigaster albostrigata]
MFDTKVIAADKYQWARIDKLADKFNSKTMRKCDICNKTDEGSEDDDVYMYGEWMTKCKITVHYFCLMLSTHLPQQGGDSSGILGFLIRDIRKEIQAAQLRKCFYCLGPGASVECHKCHEIFHLACGMESHCVNYFRDDFRSYCKDCAPRDQYQKQLMAAPQSVFKNLRCDICFDSIRVFILSKVVYGDCCRKGFAHKICMRRYAYSSGYYLRCLWCRDEKFHETIKLQSVFVPDRDATWELQKNAYSELHSKPLHCDETECLCPKGRSYSKTYNWIIQLCITCAAYGSHFKCRKDGTKDFKCELCKVIEANMQKSKDRNKEQNSQNSNKDQTNTKSQLDTSLYLSKNSPSLASDDEALHATDEESCSTEASIVTVIASQLRKSTISEPDETPTPGAEVAVETPTPILTTAAEVAVETPTPTCEDAVETPTPTPAVEASTPTPSAETEVAVEAMVIDLPDSQKIEFRLPQPPPTPEVAVETPTPTPDVEASTSTPAAEAEVAVEAMVIDLPDSQKIESRLPQPPPTPEVAIETSTPTTAVEASTSTPTPSAEAEVAVEAMVIDLPDSQKIEFRLPQPPLLLRKSFTHGEHFYLQVYDYQEQYPERCVGTWTFRFLLSDARIHDCSEQALVQLQPTMSDVWTRGRNRGIYDRIDHKEKELAMSSI